MMRHLFNLVVAVSLLLMLTATTIWVRSDGRDESINYSSRLRHDLSQTQDMLVSRYGSLVYARARVTHSAAPARLTFDPGFFVQTDDATHYADLREQFRHGGAEWMGFGLHCYTSVTPATGPWQRQHTYHAVLVPYWAVTLLLLLPPSCRFYCGWRRRRTVPGACSACGYDLRATPERCPECGTPSAPAVKADA